MADNESCDVKEHGDIISTAEGWNKYWSSADIDNEHIFDPHECLLKYQSNLLQGKPKIKVLVPLSGDTHDIKWLADLGHDVVGVEFAEKAVRHFFKIYNIDFTVKEIESLKGKVYKSSDQRIRIYVCDFFLFNPEVESEFEAVWDSGAMQSLPKAELQKYVDVIKPVMACKTHYLVEFTVPGHYKDEVTKSDLEIYFGDTFSVKELDFVPTNREFYKNFGCQGFRCYHISKK